ncbi:hypothetical protein AN958_07156 [Leucoagaricus sp. SymC.cos]|nr:hypothetical protein AN958_07156 [Leucoagaricus sp. SymC.cos]
MTTNNLTTRNTDRPLLDPSLLNLNDEESQSLKSLTGIQDDEELKHHIIKVQTKAYQLYPYPCIRIFAFTSLKISRLASYQRALELSRSRPGAILLDIGCCFGNILRKAVTDGWPVENVIGSDIHGEFWDYGHELFVSTPETFPAAFVPGDAFSPTLIEPREPYYSQPGNLRPGDLRTLISLTPLQGYVSAINASAFFHLFSEQKQLFLARQLASLLSPEPGSIIFGVHGGRKEKGVNSEVTNTRGGSMFCHSPETWIELWECQVFKPGSVKVEAKLVERAPPVGGGPRLINIWLVWSVTRL